MIKMAYLMLMGLVLRLTHAVDLFGTELPAVYCESPQYLELGAEGVIQCSFPRNLSAVHWFDNSTDENAKPLISYRDSQKDGWGYKSGDFDVFSNGSLLLRNASLLHERTFKSVCFDENQLNITVLVDVVITVSPNGEYPQISGCDYSLPVCLFEKHFEAILICHVNAARPAFEVEWLEKVDDEYQEVNSTIAIKENENSTFNTFATLTSLAPLDHKWLRMLYCRSSPKQILKWICKSLIVDMSSSEKEFPEPIESEYYLINSSAVIGCSYKTETALLWKRTYDNISETVALWTKEHRKIITPRYMDYDISKDQKLIIESVQVHHEGNYCCISSNAPWDDIEVRRLVVLVPPSPPYMVIRECQSFDCQIKSKGEGVLTCSVFGVRPLVSIEWSVNDESKVIFEKKPSTVEETSGLFYVVSSIHYEMTGTASCTEEVTVFCSAFGAATLAFNSSRGIQLQKEDCVDETTMSGHHARKIKTTVITLVVGGTVIIAISSIFIVVYLQKKRRHQRGEVDHESEESVALMPDIPVLPDEGQRFKEKREKFINELQITYAEMVANSSLISWISEDEEFPDNVYISRTMSFKLENKISTHRSQPGCLKSYEDILLEDDFEQKHFLLEGAAGQGKTFIAMQIVTDWLKSSKISPLQKFDILILLSLREMDQKTIFEQVVETLLADDTDLKPDDIEEILMKEKQYLIVLDEFEQYPKRHEKNSFVHNVMRHKIMRNTKVILMTRPTIYTKTLGKNIVFLSLNYFTPSQREQYIHCIYERKEDIGRKVTHLLQENVEVAYLCKTPLFLFMTSYLIYKQPSSVGRLRDVTSFLEYFIDSLLTSFLTNPSETYTPEAQIEDKYPRNLTQIAIRGLADLQHSWSKQYVVEQSCLKDVNNLVDIKIFIESEKTVQSGREEAERHQIRFSHEIFQYFYGAIYLAFYASSDEFKSFVERVNKHNCQILFVFTCGLSKKSEHVKKIVELLLKEKDYHPFPIRDCIVQCLVHAKSVSLEEMKDELTALCSMEHGLRLLDAEDKALKNAKAKIINVCYNLKVPINVIALNKVLAGAKDDTVLLDCGASIKLPDNVITYSFTDFNGHFTDKHCMRLIERTKNMSEVVIFSSLMPSLCTSEALDKMTDTELTVLWVTYKGDHVVSVSTPSKYIGKWVRYSAIVAINHLRQFKGWTSLPPEEKQRKEKEIVSEIEKKGLQIFFNSSQHFSEEEGNILLSRIDDDLKIIQSVITGWYGAFEALSEEAVAERRRDYKKLVSKLTRRIFTQLTATSLDQLTNDSESDDDEDEDDDNDPEEYEPTMREFSEGVKLLVALKVFLSD